MGGQDLLLSFLPKLNALVGGVFLLSAFGLLAIRQMLTCLRLYVFQSLLLATSTLILGFHYSSIHLIVVAGLTVIARWSLFPGSCVAPWAMKVSPNGKFPRSSIYRLRYS